MSWLDMLADGYDRLLAKTNPEAAVRRAQARRILAAYEAAKPTTLRKQSKDATSGNLWVSAAGNNLRNQARYLDANHDLAKGVLNALVNNIVGANGIGIEPQPRLLNNEIDDKLADQLLRLFKDWSNKPECTFTYDWPSAQRMLCRSWLRDGEAFAKDLLGNIQYLDHGTEVKYTLELLESDMLPLNYDDADKRIVQGIETNGWGMPTNYHFFKNHPGEITVYNHKSLDLRPVSAALINHIRLRDRIGQIRGVSVFASVMTRLDDIKDYEESERIAAKIAACMSAYIKKGVPDMYQEPGDNCAAREINFRPGMVFDDLSPGEDVGTIDTNRPNTNLVSFRDGQIRMISSGTGANASTISRNYDGSYSSQRQELVEGYINYSVLSSEFINAIVAPVWRKFVNMVIAQGLVKMPRGIDPLSIDDALFIPPAMPWIDPEKEMNGYVLGERASYISGQEVIRKRGGHPKDVLEQEARWRKMLKDKEIISVSDPANDVTKTPPEVKKIA